MGVHGLTTYIEKDRRFLVDIRLQATRLVIDGSSLYFSLYFSSGADQQCGGEYDAFASQVRQFFSCLSACQIQPFVVLDGGMDQSDKKFSTLRQRALRYIQDAHTLSRGTSRCVLPLLTKAMFIQLLTELAVPLFQCAGEADIEIATLAGHWGCPVLTNDSDFFIFNLRGGYLPFRYFQWGNVPVGRHSASHLCYIPARCYNINRLCSHFRGLKPQMLPLLAMFLGNDYTPARTLGHLELPVVGKGANCQIEGILLWLSQFSSPADALDVMVEVEGGGRGGGRRGQSKNLAQAAFFATIGDYTLTTRSSLAQFFSGGLPDFSHFMGIPEVLAAQPEWLLWGIFTGRLPSMIQDVLVLQRVMLHAQVENSRLPSSHCASIGIRQAIYGLLLLGRQGVCPQARGSREKGRGKRGKSGCVAGSQGSQSQAIATVVEYDRKDLNLATSTVMPLLPSNVQKLHLDTMDQVPLPPRLQLLLAVLPLEDHQLATLPPILQLPMCVTSFWLLNCKPRPDTTLLQALLLGFTLGELKYSLSLPTAHRRPGVAAVIQKLTQMKSVKTEGRGLNLEVAHGLSQWQSCMSAGLCLNQLLCCPLPDPPCYWLFSGTLVHALRAALKRGVPAEALLAGDPLPGQLFSSLLQALQGPGGPPAHPTASRKRGKGPRGPAPGGRGQGARGRGKGRGRGRGPGANGGDIHNRFSMLMMSHGDGDSDDDDDDDDDDED